MKRLVALAVMITFSGLLSAGQVSAERPKGKDVGNEEMIRSLHSQEVEALMHKDINATAVAAGTESIVPDKKMPGAGRTMNLRFTTIWVKQGGRWQEVARQASIVQQPQPQAPAK